MSEQGLPVAVLPPPPKKRAPTLYVIIAIKLCKGTSLLLLALAVWSLANADLSGLYQSLLQWVNVDPEQQFFVKVAQKIRAITPANVYWVAAGTAFYSLFSLLEGIGLIFRLGWAGWMAISESAFFIPIEVYDLLGGFSRTVFVILLLNVGIVWYLLQNRHRLFRHH
jgi:uncharacterized membrane protein (DUF2068 family)